jgi:hypothetical protein
MSRGWLLGIGSTILYNMISYLISLANIDIYNNKIILSIKR